MIVTNAGVIIRLDVADISQNGRAAQGVRLIRLGDDQFVSTVAKVKKMQKMKRMKMSNLLQLYLKMDPNKNVKSGCNDAKHQECNSY